MEAITSKSTNWNDAEWPAPTQGPGVSVEEMIEEEPALTVVTIVGVTLVVLLTIAAVFVLGVLIDCRHQRIQEEKMGQIKRLKNRRLKSKPDMESLSIAVNMEGPGLSSPPAEAIIDIP